MNVNQVLEALSVVHSPVVSDQQRLDAHKFLDSFKENLSPIEVITVSLSLLKDTSLSTQARHFGLQCFEHVVMSNWNTLADSEKKTVKDEVFLLANSPICDISNPQLYVLSSQLCVVFVEIAKREWPQNWPELFPFLENLSKSNVNGAYLCLKVVSMIGEAAFIPNVNLPDRRRKDMLNTIMCMKEDLSRLLSHLIDSIATHSKTASPFVAKTSLTVCAEALSYYCDKIPFPLLKEHGLIEWLAKLLFVSSISNDIHEVIINLFCRKYTSTPECYQEVVLIWRTILQHTMQILQSPTTMSNYDDKLNMLLKTTRSLKIFISTHTYLLANTIKPSGVSAAILSEVNEIRVITLQVLAVMLDFNSVQVVGETVLNFNEVFRLFHSFYLDHSNSDTTVPVTHPSKEDKFSRKKIGIDIGGLLLGKLVVLMVKKEEDDYINEFDTVAAYQHAYSTLRVQSISLASQIAGYDALCAVTKLGELLFASLSQLNNCPISFTKCRTHPLFCEQLNTALAPMCIMSDVVVSDAFVQLETLTVLFEHVYKVVDQLLYHNPLYQPSEDGTVPGATMPPHLIQQQQQVLTMTQEILSLLMNFSCDDMATFTPKVRLLSMLTPLFNLAITNPPPNNEANIAYVVLSSCFQVLTHKYTIITDGAADQQETATELDLSQSQSSGFNVRMPSNKQSSMRTEALIDIRRRACYTLLSLSKRCPLVFKPFYSQIYSEVNRYMQDNIVSNSESIYLLEFLLLLTLHNCSDSEQTLFIRNIVERHVNILYNDEFSFISSDIPAFKTLVGISDLEQSIFVQQLQRQAAPTETSASSMAVNPSQKWRYDVFYALNTICSVARTLASYRTDSVDFLRVVNMSNEQKNMIMSAAKTDSDIASVIPTQSSERSGELPDSAHPTHPVLAELVRILFPRLLQLLLTITTVLSEDQLATLPLRMQILHCPSFNHMLLATQADGFLPNSPPITTPSLPASVSSLTPPTQATLALVNTFTGSAEHPPASRQNHVARDVVCWVEQVHELVLQMIEIFTQAKTEFFECFHLHGALFIQVVESYKNQSPKKMTKMITRLLTPLLFRLPVDRYTTYLPHLLTVINNTVIPYLKQMQVHQHYLNSPADDANSPLLQALASVVGYNYHSVLLRLRGSVRMPVNHVPLPPVRYSVAQLQQIPVLASVPHDLLEHLAQHDLSHVLRQDPSGVLVVAVSALSAGGDFERQLDILESADYSELLSSASHLFHRVMDNKVSDQKAYERIIKSFTSIDKNGMQANNFFSEYLCVNPDTLSHVFSYAKRLINITNNTAIFNGVKIIRRLAAFAGIFLHSTIHSTSPTPVPTLAPGEIVSESLMAATVQYHAACKVFAEFGVIHCPHSYYHYSKLHHTSMQQSAPILAQFITEWLSLLVTVLLRHYRSTPVVTMFSLTDMSIDEICFSMRDVLSFCVNLNLNSFTEVFSAFGPSSTHYLDMIKGCMTTIEPPPNSAPGTGVDIGINSRQQKQRWREVLLEIITTEQNKNETVQKVRDGKQILDLDTVVEVIRERKTNTSIGLGDVNFNNVL